MKKGILFSTLTLLIMSAMILGFSFSSDPGDRSPINPTVSKNNPYTVYGAPLTGTVSTISESFEATTFPPAGWIKLNPGGGPGWNRQTAGTTPVPGFNGGYITVPTGGGTAVAFGNYITGNSSGGSTGLSDQWLVTPQITNVQANDSLSFWIRKFGNYIDNINVKISTTTPTVAGMTISVASIPFAAADSGWVQYKYKIGGLVPNGSNIYIGIEEYVANVAIDGASFSLDLFNYTQAAAPVTLTWTEQTSGISSALYSVSAVSNDIAWACGAAGKVLKTTNKGVNWVNVSGNIPTSLPLYCIWGQDANMALVTGTTSGGVMSIYKTTNGGTNWTLVNSHAGFGDNIWMTSATDAYFIGDPVSGHWDLLKSTNAGDNWTTWATITTTNTSGTYNNAAFHDNQQVWFSPVGESSFQYTSNMGTNWSVQTIPLSEIAATWFNSATVGIAGGSSTSAGLLKTTNSGTNWTTLTQSFVGTSSIAGITGTGTSWWVALQAATVHTSTNDGATWTLAYTAPTTGGVFYHLTASRTGNTIWGVRSLGGISRYGEQISGITPIGTVTPTSYSLSQNYPNPFNPTTKINFSIPKSGMVSLKVYDILGKEVSTLVNQNISAGNYTYEFDASRLSSGIYFYRLNVNGFSEVKKMSLIK